MGNVLVSGNLTPEQIFYLKDRGFRLVYRQPSESAKYPYISLGDCSAMGCPAVYHLRQGVDSICAEANPLIPKNQAVGFLEKTIVNTMALEGRTVVTKPGNPILVYVADNKWRQIAQALAKKYPAKKHYNPR